MELTDSDDMCSSSSADPSPASSPGPRRQQIPGLRLSLGGLAAPSSPGVKVPSLSLWGAGWPGGDAPLTARSGAAHPPAAAAAEVSLLSPAFTLGGPEAGDLEASCTARLGVAQQRLRFFQLVEARDLRQLQAQGCTRFVVEVAESSFSLQALEEVVAENAAMKQRSSESSTEAEDLRQQLAELELQAAALRQRLQSSEALRQKGKKALGELSREFASLHKELTHTQGAPYSPRIKANMGTPAALADALVPGSI